MRNLFKKAMVLCISAALLTGGGFTASSDSQKTAKAASDNRPLSLNDQFTDGTISAGGEVDFYTLTLAAPGWLTVTYQGWNIGDGYYAVLNYDQTEEYTKNEIYTSSDTNPLTNSETLALEAGTYIVKVWGYSDHTGDYKLKASYMAADNDETEPNNYFQSAMALQSKTLVTGFFSRQDQVDFYSFRLNSAATIDVTLTTRVGDMYFSVWNQDFMEVDKREVYTASESNPLTSTMQLNLEAGTYYIKCNPYSSDCGRYQLKWGLAPTLVTAISIKGNKVISAGKSLKLSASVKPSNANNKKVTWSTGNQYVASVNKKTGKVTANNPGYADITATATDGSNIQATVRVIVAPKKMAKPGVKAKGKKTVAISWKAQTGASQYQIQYSKKSSFKGAKTISVSQYSTSTTATLKKGVFYFRIRTVSYIDGANVNGKWSAGKKVKVK